MSEDNVARGLVLLDRDGTINVERQYLSSPDGMELIPGAAEGIRLLRSAGHRVAVVTNQSGIARGYFDWDRLHAIHARMLALLEDGGASLDGIYVCPHHPSDGCECRKPAPGLAFAAAQDLGCTLDGAFVFGDKGCDIELGRSIKATTVLVRTGYGGLEDGERAPEADHVVDDLVSGARLVVVAATKRGGVDDQ